ncbi:Peptidyl-prolyl cis-trans isomerase PpiD [hydrothermal vent metagenome]|uniref:Peptidyl-prolyl cis-trans isomerase PpiD n=1 Tax=hydrothermal vent metagenome TaxID=652676 RepID=A0A1W1EE82_9ZZZZ
MISWMQKHNKYLVWTIWVATIAFIGAGFVGWGSYDFGAKAGNVAKVGSIEIPQSKLNTVYSDIYGQVNQRMNGQLDDKKAKEMGLIKEAFSRINTQAKLLNFAKDVGIIVSDKEVADALQNIKAFQKDGMFNKEIYNGFLRARRMKARIFEEQLHEEIMITKTMNLLNIDPLPLEIEAISSAMNVSDKISYKVLSASDVNITIDDAEMKKFWEARKDNFMTKKTYQLDVVWTNSDETKVDDSELKPFFEKNSFNYSDKEGKHLTFEAAKDKVLVDLKLKKTKKAAQLNYIAFKKGEMKSSETLTLEIDDNKLSKELWDDIKQKNISDITKPKIVGNQYATVKIVSVKTPQVKTYEEAKAEVSELYTVQAQAEALSKLAKETLNKFDELDTTTSDFLTLNNSVNINSLNSEESLQFLQKLFTSTKEKGIISLSEKVIVYKIMEQKLSPMVKENQNLLNQTVNQIKQNIFESNFIKILDEKYPTEVYMEGLTN